MILFIPLAAKKASLDPQIAIMVNLILVVVGFCGARLLHVFYEDWPLYQEQPLRIFYVWLGGFVFLGGAVPAAAAAAAYLRWQGQNFARWGDFYAPIVAIGYGLGRLSCFFSGCCYGTYCDLPWAIANRHPTQLYAMGWELIIAFGLIYGRQRLLQRLGQGGIFWTWVFAHAVGRIFLEALRADDRGPMLFGLSISTVICLFLVSASSCQLILQLTAKTVRK